ncbi:MAG: hypothetical protein IJP26_00725 [Clostridia bacterium]|nr:hypothetical protein [Clostridia bacterium]
MTEISVASAIGFSGVYSGFNIFSLRRLLSLIICFVFVTPSAEKLTNTGAEAIVAILYSPIRLIMLRLASGRLLPHCAPCHWSPT